MKIASRSYELSSSYHSKNRFMIFDDRLGSDRKSQDPCHKHVSNKGLSNMRDELESMELL